MSDGEQQHRLSNKEGLRPAQCCCSHAWPSSPANPGLHADEVHVWRACLDHPVARRSFLWQVLTDDERARAKKFHFPIAQQRFAVARGMLRITLSNYLSLRPEQLRFNYNDYGKPFLMDEQAKNISLNFNLSHSQGMAIYAITCKREIGVDLEYIKPGFVDAEIMGQIFSAREIIQFKALPEDIRERALFNCWTRKEAFVKAKGVGLSLSPNKFEVAIMPDKQRALLHVPNSQDEMSRWDLRSLNVGSAYAAALAVEGHDWQIKYWQFDETIADS